MNRVPKPVRARLSTAFVALVLPMMLASLTAFPAQAQNTIKILVNDDPVTSYDIQQRTQMIRTFTRGKQGKTEAVNQLIDEQLMLQEAKRRGINVTDSDVESEFAVRARAAGLTPAQFTQAMRQAGFDARTFKNFLRANMAWSQMVRSRFRATVSISDQDVAAALTGKKPDEAAAQKNAVEYRLQQIIFVLPKNASKSYIAQQRKAASEFRAALKSCDQSLQLAAGKSGVVVQPPIRREEGQLSEQQRAELAKLPVGSVTEPQVVPGGVQILAVCSKQDIQGETEAELNVRQDLSTERGKMLARRYLRDLRSDAVIEYR